MARRLAVTGANGFVGRHLTVAASAAGWEVVGIVRSEAAARMVVDTGGRPAVAGDLDGPRLAAALAGADAVVHLAQIGAERDGATYEAVNVGGTRRLIEAARAAGVRRVVFLSGLGVARYGMSRRTTNRYFLSKLACEVELYRSGLDVAVLRPSYVVGPRDAFVADLLRQMDAGEVERIGDGTYRMQPVAVRDAAAAILAAAERSGSHPLVVELVGPEPVTFQDLLERVARLASATGKGGPHRMRSLSVDDADRQAAAGGWRGMLPDELDCLLCDEVGDPRPLEALLGRFLTPLEEALAAAIRAA